MGRHRLIPDGRMRMKRMTPWLIVAALVAVTGGVVLVNGPPQPTDVGSPESVIRQQGLAPNNPAAPGWTSGAWIGGRVSAQSMQEFGQWRGSRATAATVYPAYDSWSDIKQSNWHVSTFDGFEGRLVYGLPLLPKDGSARLEDVASGANDDVWSAVASTLLQHGRGDSFVRIGLEANGTWFPWGARATTATEFKEAYRHVASTLRATAPDLQLVFDISCGVPLEGASDRLASLTSLYPGDEVVDVVGCDHYDSYSAKARNEAEWANAVAPKNAAGLQDVVTFAQAHGKKFAVPEWGLSGPQSKGTGDNPFFISKMHQFFTSNRGVLAFENYFDEPDAYLTSSLFQQDQNPKSAELYRALWSSVARPSPGSSATATEP